MLPKLYGGAMRKTGLAIAAVLAIAALASRPASSRSSCPAALETDFYSDGTYTTKVGMCVMTCQQWDLDPGQLGTCTGTITSYYKGGPIRQCPCPP
jgi:hypothetical protein